MLLANCCKTSWESPFKLKTDICLRSLEKTLPSASSESRSPLLSITAPDCSVKAPSPWSLLNVSLSSLASSDFITWQLPIVSPKPPVLTCRLCPCYSQFFVPELSAFRWKVSSFPPHPHSSC